MKLGFTNGKDCPPCGRMLDGVQAARSRKPKAIRSSRLADFDMILPLFIRRRYLASPNAQIHAGHPDKEKATAGLPRGQLEGIGRWP